MNLVNLCAKITGVLGLKVGDEHGESVCSRITCVLDLKLNDDPVESHYSINTVIFCT